MDENSIRRLAAGRAEAECNQAGEKKDELVSRAAAQTGLFTATRTEFVIVREVTRHVRQRPPSNTHAALTRRWSG